MVKLIIVLSFFSLRFLYTISKLWGFLNISHLNDCKRLIKIHSFFVNSEVRNVEICTYFLERAKKKKCLFRGNGMTLTIFPPWSRYEFYVISLKIIFLFSLVRNVTEKCISVSTVAPMTNDYTLWHVPFFALNSLPSRRKVNEKSPGGG